MPTLRWERGAGAALAAALFAAGIFAAGPAVAAKPSPGHALGQYNIDEAETSVSGISSGAYMAVQLGVAWSSTIVGVGAVAGGPFDCARGITLGGIAYIPDLRKPTGPCMLATPEAPDLAKSIKATTDFAASGDIDDPKNLDHQKIYLFDGYNDGVVRRKVEDTLFDYYKHFVSAEHLGNIYYQSEIGAGHALVTDHDKVKGAEHKALACAKTGGNFIVDCQYDQAGLILQHIYGELNPRNNGKLTGELISFDQSDFVTGGIAVRKATSLGRKGYVYVPSACEKGAQCRVHIAIHGCAQFAGAPDYTGIPPEPKDLDYVALTGYREWADTNNLIVLYPQTEPSSSVPFNPKGCWDWWGYTNGKFDTKSGYQIEAIKAMLDSMVDPKVKKPEEPAPKDLDLAVSDTSATEAALIWHPQSLTASYDVYRKGAQGFEKIGTATGGSFGDQGLAPETDYAYYIQAADGTKSAEVAAKTKKIAAPCDPFFGPAIAQFQDGRLILADKLRPYHYSALGSNQIVDVNSQFEDVNLIQTKPGYFEKGTCPAG
jgi:hypothetical protein